MSKISVISNVVYMAMTEPIWFEHKKRKPGDLIERLSDKDRRILSSATSGDFNYYFEGWEVDEKAKRPIWPKKEREWKEKIERRWTEINSNIVGLFILFISELWC